MYIVPNNKLSNHFRKKRVERQVWIDDQTVSDSFYQNIESMKEKTNNRMFYGDYLIPKIFCSDNYYPNVLCNSHPSMSVANNVFGMNIFSDDGLSDWEEAAKYGTNWKDPDCDDDFLLDGDEVKKYGTDPNNPDTDNDKILDR